MIQAFSAKYAHRPRTFMLALAATKPRPLLSTAYFRFARTLMLFQNIGFIFGTVRSLRVALSANPENKDMVSTGSVCIIILEQLRDMYLGR